MLLFQVCFNCGSQIHVRKLACLCGHVFRGSKLLTIKARRYIRPLAALNHNWHWRI